jgi:TonB family protein
MKFLFGLMVPIASLSLSLAQSAAPGTGHQAKPHPFRIVCPPLALKTKTFVKPVYPRLAVLANVHGRVIVDVLVSKEGVPVEVTTVEGHPLLAEAAVKAVKEWRYRPVLLKDEPIEVITRVTINFVPHAKKTGWNLQPVWV